MYEVIEVTAIKGSESFLFVSDEAALLLDAGYAFCAGKLIENIKEALDGRTLDMILLTHSHYDHANGCVRVKEAYPEAVVAASELAVKIFGRENAVKTMKNLDDIAAKRAGQPADSECVSDIHVDVTVGDGDVISCKDMRIRAMAAPGHTRCSLNFYFEDTGLLAACETMGIAPTYPVLQPCYVIGYDLTMESIKRARECDPRHVFIAHYGMIPDEDVGTYFDRAEQSVVDIKDVVVNAYKREKDIGGVMQTLTEKYYIPEVEELQPIEAFNMNFEVLARRTLADQGYELEENGA